LNASAFAQEKKYQQVNHYISSLATNARTFAGFVSIGELKTVCIGLRCDFWRDAAPFRNYHAATNWSIIRNIINLARKSGYDSLTKAERFLTHDIDKLFYF